MCPCIKKYLLINRQNFVVYFTKLCPIMTSRDSSQFPNFYHEDCNSRIIECSNLHLRVHTGYRVHHSPAQANHSGSGAPVALHCTACCDEGSKTGNSTEPLHSLLGKTGQSMRVDPSVATQMYTWYSCLLLCPSLLQSTPGRWPLRTLPMALRMSSIWYCEPSGTISAHQHRWFQLHLPNEITCVSKSDPVCKTDVFVFGNFRGCSLKISPDVTCESLKCPKKQFHKQGHF